MKNKNIDAKSRVATRKTRSLIAKVPNKHEETAATDQESNVAIDRPGFDLGGSTGSTTAGTGLGSGRDAAESVKDRSLPGRHTKPTLTIPRWSGPEGAVRDRSVKFPLLKDGK